MTDRERFLAVLYNLPLERADAIVVLAGDGEARLEFGIGMMQAGGAAALVLSGGIDAPPFSLTATELARRAIEKGVDPTRIVIDADSKHTRDQAVNVLRIAQEREWTRLLLVASPFHLPRAFLTFVARLAEFGATDTVRIIPAAASQVAWWQIPAGETRDRLALMNSELVKIEEYGQLGHVAGYVAGLEYLRRWEGK